MFTQLFAVLLATVVFAQLLTFLLVLLVPSPPPHVTPLLNIADALRTGRPPDTTLRINLSARPGDNLVDPQEADTARVLALQIGVASDRVRVVLRRATRFHRPAPPDNRLDIFDARLPGGFGHPPQAGASDILIGRFEAGLLLQSGQWRVVSPAIGRVDVWQIEVLAWLFGVLLAVTPIAWLFARRLSKPIAAFAGAAERLGKDPRRGPITVTAPREIMAAADAFNEMQARLTRYVDDRTNMVAAIAHDLRTPLMRLALRLQKAPPDIRMSSGADIREIQDMVTAALSFVRDISVAGLRQRLALRPLLETVVNDMIDLDQPVTLEPGEDAAIVADLAGLKRMLVNLVSNGVTHGGGARVCMLVEPGRVIIEVEDCGPGLAEEELDRVFEPFYRVDRSRNRATGGAGLGLASARAVARAHGGDIELVNRAGGGLTARAILPL